MSILNEFGDTDVKVITFAKYILNFKSSLHILHGRWKWLSDLEDNNDVIPLHLYLN